MPLNTSYTDNQAQDAAGRVLNLASGNIAFTYDAATNTLSANAPEPAAPYTLPVATSTTRGGVKIGEGVTVAADGTITVEDTRLVDMYLAGKALNIDTASGSFEVDFSSVIPEAQPVPVAVKSIGYNDGGNLLATMTDNSQVDIDLADFCSFILQQAQTATQINSVSLTGTSLAINTNAKGSQSVDLSSLAGSRIIYQKPGRNMAYQTGSFYYSDPGILYEFIGTGFVAASNLSPSANMRRVAGVGTAMTNVARSGNNLVFTLSDGQTLTRDITPSGGTGTAETNYHIVANMPKNAAGNYEYKQGHVYQGAYGTYLCTDADKESADQPITQTGWINLGVSSSFLPANGAENNVLMWKYGTPNWVDKFDLFTGTVYTQYESNQRFALKTDVKTYKAGTNITISSDGTISSTALGGSGSTTIEDHSITFVKLAGDVYDYIDAKVADISPYLFGNTLVIATDTGVERTVDLSPLLGSGTGSGTATAYYLLPTSQLQPYLQSVALTNVAGGVTSYIAPGNASVTDPAGFYTNGSTSLNLPAGKRYSYTMTMRFVTDGSTYSGGVSFGLTSTALSDNDAEIANKNWFQLTNGKSQTLVFTDIILGGFSHRMGFRLDSTADKLQWRYSLKIQEL